MALNPRPQSCEKNMLPNEGRAKSPYKPSQVQINVQPSRADQIPVTTNEMQTLKPTEVLIAEMSSAFERFVSHFRELETALPQERTGGPGENSVNADDRKDSEDLQVPHKKQLLEALSRNGLTWEDYKKTMAYLESENETTPPDNQTGPVEFDESDTEMNNILSDQKRSDNPAVPMATPSGKPTPTIIPQTRESNSCWDGSHLTSVTREKILICEPSLQMMNIKSSTSKTKEELKEILEKQLEETRSKNLSHYADILKSTERWRSSSHDMEQTSTTITSKWLDPLRDPEEPRPSGEDIHLTGSLSDSLEEQLERERELIKQRMAELERFRAEEENRLRRIEQLAREARQTRQRSTEFLFEPITSSETPSERPKTADNTASWRPSVGPKRWHSSTKITPNSSTECVPAPDNQWLKIKDVKLKHAWNGPVRPSTTATVYSTECRTNERESEKKLIPDYRFEKQPYSVPQRSSSEGRRTVHFSSRRLSGSRRNSSSRDSRSDNSSSVPARLPMLFTKKLDKALEEISPYALPETTSSSNLACWTTCVEEDQCKNTVVQANGDPGAKKFYGPATVQAEMEVKPNELRSLPDLGRACLSVHEERFIGDKSRSNRNSRTFAVSPNGRVAISPSKIVESREQYPRLLEETGTCPTDYLHSCHLTRTITPASSLCQNQTIPLQISLGGRTISSVTTQSIPSIGIVSPESTNGRPSTVMGLANNSESKKSKCYQINITLDLDQALQHYNLQRQTLLSPTRVQVPGNHLLATVVRRCDTDCKSVSEIQPAPIPNKLPSNGLPTNAAGLPSRARIRDVQIISRPKVRSPEVSGKLDDVKQPQYHKLKIGKKSLIKTSVGIQPKNLNESESTVAVRQLQVPDTPASTNTDASLPWPPTASKQPLQLSGIAHCADDHVVPSSQAVHNVTEDETALPEGSTLVEGHSLPLPSNQDAQPGRQLQQRSSSHSETAYYSLSTNGMASDRGSCAFATEVPSNISLSDSNNLTSIPLKSSHYSQNGRTSNKLNKCAKPNSKESKLGAETGVHPSSPQPRKTRRPVSVTYVEPRSCGESTETLLSVAPQVAKLVESALLVRPDVQDLKDGEIPAIPRQRSCSRTPTPIYTPPPIKTTVVSSGKSSTSRGFISPQSIQREEECSFSSYHGDEISAQMKFIQEQLCLQSVSDPIDLAESPTSPCSASTSPITGASINKMSVDPRVYRDKIEATYSADDRARPKSRLNSGAAQKPDHNCGDLEGGSTSGTIWTQAQSWSVDPNNDNDLSNLVKPEIPFCVEEVHSSEQCRFNQTDGLVQSKPTCLLIRDDQEKTTQNHPKSQNVRRESTATGIHTGRNNNASCIAENTVIPASLESPGNSHASVQEEVAQKMLLKWVNSVLQTQHSISKIKVKNPGRIFPRKKSRPISISSERCDLHALLEKLDHQSSDGDNHLENYAMIANRIALGLTTSDCLSQLIHLRVIHLTRCRLSSDFLNNLDPLPYLEWLDLSHNNLNYLQCKTDTFPKLLILDVSHNCFEHLDHLGGPYASLLKLNIRSNFLSSIDRIQQRIQMPQLHVLDLRDNLFTSTSTIRLNNCTPQFIGQINLGGNQIAQLNTPLFAGHLITHLDLSNNLLDNLPIDGVSTPMLQHLALHRNNLCSLDILEQSWLPNLRVLLADENRISRIPSLSCPKLETFSLRNNQIHDASNSISDLQNLPKLHTLNLQCNPCCLDEQFVTVIRQALPNLVSLNGTRSTTAYVSDSLPRPNSPQFHEDDELYFPARYCPIMPSVYLSCQLSSHSTESLATLC